MAKLFVALALFACCVAVTQAAVTITTYADGNCTMATGFYSTNDLCSIVKRSVLGEPECYQFSDSGVYYNLNECSNTLEEPQVPVPTGWQQFKFSKLENCNFTDIYEISAVPDVGSNILVLQLVEGIIFIFNNTVSCNNEGILAIDTCFQYGCYSFESVPNGVCTNVTTATFDQFFNGIQTSCVAAPVSEPVAAPVSAPVATPVAAPVAAPVKAPVKKTSSAVSVVGSALTTLAVATLLC
jgi:hypothetical protein